MGDPFVTMQHQELKEALLEIKRHHADFKRISDILEKINGAEDGERATHDALKAIRNIVG